MLMCDKDASEWGYLMPSPAPLPSQRCASMLQRKLRLKRLGFGFGSRQVAAYTCCSSVQDPLRAPAISLLEGRVQILSAGRGVEGKGECQWHCARAANHRTNE